MLAFILQAAIAFCIYWILYRLCHLSKALFSTSPLHDVPGPAKQFFVLGNLSQFYAHHGLAWHFNMVKKYGRVFKFYGFFGDEQLYVTDPKAMYHILIRDQRVFEETPKFLVANKLIFGEGLLATTGEQHRRQRKILNPLFSTTHIKSLTPVFYSVANQMVEYLSTQVKSGPQELDMLYLMSEVSLECIGRGGLGYSFSTFSHGNHHNLSRSLKTLGGSITALSIPRYLLPYVAGIGPAWLRRLLWNSIPSRVTRELAESVNVMHRTSTEILNDKVKVCTESDEARGCNDIMNVLLKANSSADESDHLSSEEVLGQLTTLIAAARGTTSTTLTRILQMLAQRTDAQTTLRREVLDARARTGQRDLGHDDLMSLPYLDATIKETLRLTPPFSSVQRVNRCSITLPLSTPLPNSPETNVLHLPKDTTVTVGIAAANCDPLIWGADAAEWKPERWLGKRVDEVAGEKLPGIYSGMMTFLGGGRACLGFRFSVLETKVVLSTLISNFILESTGDEVIWQNPVIVSPTRSVRGEPCLNLRVRAFGKDVDNV